MPSNRPGSLDQLREIWSRLLWSQRLTILVFGFLGLALIGSVVYFMNRVEYEALYRDLNPEDAQAIVAKLKDEKKDFIVQGTSILVAAPKNEIDKLRLEISGSGLARSGRIGYEIFDKNQFGMTDFTEQVNLQRALEGELARTISSLSEISHARVHIVLPKDSIFDEKKEDAKASVVLALRKGAELSKSGITGIKGVVAGAVPGLHTYNVSIVDDDGRLLSQSFEAGNAPGTEMESGIREQLEREMSGKVISILEPLVGRGRVHANASIDLDFNTAEQTEESLNPNSSGKSLSLPGNVRQGDASNQEVNQLVRHAVPPKGAIRRLSIAVILDHKTAYSTASDGKLASHAEPRSQKEIAAYRELVLAAIGYDEQRGDVVSIENVPFYSESRPEERPPAVSWYFKWQAYLLPAMKYGSFIILFLFIYLVLFRPIRKQVFQALSVASLRPAGAGVAQLTSENSSMPFREAGPTERMTASAAPGAMANLQAGEPGAPDELLDAAGEEQIERELMKEAETADMDNRKYAAVKKKLVDKAKRDPEMVSQLIRSLLREKV